MSDSIGVSSESDTSLPEGLLVIANRSKDLEAQVLLLKMRHHAKHRSGLTSLRSGREQRHVIRIDDDFLFVLTRQQVLAAENLNFTFNADFCQLPIQLF
ncbi:hypothetical protein HFO55_01435 [Rhizobium leguminosarum]|uniref:hypothetical protein n=1 Tax=Rhizobium leguminosarum TaxID=384 RepID=UPI001C9880BC|nr:hypothetical protein [Rhizobium leguminosarum]MBY5565924.1 hypothetical protein [Rhizobium leguminosarum]MBY5573096.1 hypothetical protein [Rhizobium leguminosarum]